MAVKFVISMRRVVQRPPVRAVCVLQQQHQQRHSSNFFYYAAAATAGVGCALAYSAEEQEDCYVEPSTGHRFPHRDGNLVFLGAGVRTKYFFKVYAVGLYCDPNQGGFGEVYRTGSKEDIFNAIITSKTDKKILLVFQRDITGADMKSAFNDSLLPRIGDKESDRQALEEFFKQFDGLQLGKQSALSFEIGYSPSGVSVSTKHQGQLKGVIRNAALAKALLDLYVGVRDPIVPDLKANIVVNKQKFLLKAQ